MVSETCWRNGMKRMALLYMAGRKTRRKGEAWPRGEREEKEQTWRMEERMGSEVKMEKRIAKDHKKPTVLVNKVIEHPYWYAWHTYFICSLHLVGYIMNCSCTIKEKKKTLGRNPRALMYKESLIWNQNRLLPGFKWHAALWFSWNREMESTQHSLHSCHPVMLLRCVPSVMPIGNVTDTLK